MSIPNRAVRSENGQTVHYRCYEITDLGVFDWMAARKFYLESCAAFGRLGAACDPQRPTGRLRPQNPASRDPPRSRGRMCGVLPPPSSVSS